MGLTRLAISRPVVILMMVSAFLVLGIISYFKLPAELNPKVDFPRVTIRTTYAGTNPQEMETLGELLKKHLEQYTKDTKVADEVLKTGSKPANAKLDKAELAAWTSVTRTILNLHAGVTRN